MKFAAVRLIGKMEWICEPCLKKAGTSDPIKKNSTPHCLECGKHHAVHVDCSGKDITPPPIDYMAMFYSNPKYTDVIGIA